MKLDDLLVIGKPAMNKTPVTTPATIKLTRHRDGFHHELMNRVRLNRYDIKFMGNIMEKYILPNKPLSPGQNSLYEKIIHKYRKQLRKMNVNYKDIIALPWKNGIIPLEVLNEKTFFRIDEDEMQLYFNFNKTKIEEVRAIVHDDNGNHLNRGDLTNFGNGQKYNFNWNNPTKTWSGPFNVYLFKQLYKFATGTQVRIHSSVTNVIDTLGRAGTKEEWTPSVKIIFGRMYVSHIAETMLPVLETIDPTDLSIVNIERMTRLGLAAPAICSHINKYVNGASAAIEHAIETAEDVATLRNYVTESGRRVVFYIPELLAETHKLGAISALKDCSTWGADKQVTLSTALISPHSRADLSEELDKFLEEGYNTLITNTNSYKLLTTRGASLIRDQTQIGKFALAADKVIYIKLKETK